VKFGIALGAVHHAAFVDVALLADELGYESIWLPEHLVLTAQMSRSPHPGEEHPPVPPNVPIYEPFAYLAFLAAKTTHVRLGTHVYNIGLRHPFTTARGVQTLDILSGGRLEFGIGASWLEEEWEAVGLDFKTRGRRVDEAIEICKRLWTEEEVSHHGEFFQFDTVMFEPKPLQKPWPPLLIGGESKAALRRAATHCDGWIGMNNDFERAAELIGELERLLEERERDPSTFQFCLGGRVASKDDVKRWEELGVTRLVFAPWKRSRDALDGIRRFADEIGVAEH
jgi:probable F420-dependent oxidoreductase